MRRETFHLSQKELQRVAVISSCVKGELTCARAAELLDLTPRQIKRLKTRYRQGSAAALAHVSRGRVSPRRLPERTRARILELARTRYAGFNDHHFCEKLCDVESLSIGRETLRRLLRSAGIGSSRKRRAPAHGQRRLARAREGEMVLLDASVHHWLEDRGPQLTLLGFLDDATRKVPVAEFFLTEDAHGYFRLLRRLLRRYGVPLSFYGDRHGGVCLPPSGIVCSAPRRWSPEVLSRNLPEDIEHAKRCDPLGQSPCQSRPRIPTSRSTSDRSCRYRW
jgi:transposase